MHRVSTKTIEQMTLKEQLYKAIKIATAIHGEQTDKYGVPYIGHVMRVCFAGHTMEEKIIGALHDVVEDSDWTLETLKSEGFSQTIIDGVDAMTKRDGEEYEDYLHRLGKNPIAVRVKLNDLTDNMDIRRCNEITTLELSRLQKYLKAYKRLTEKTER